MEKLNSASLVSGCERSCVVVYFYVHIFVLYTTLLSSYMKQLNWILKKNILEFIEIANWKSSLGLTGVPAINKIDY